MITFFVRSLTAKKLRAKEDGMAPSGSTGKLIRLEIENFKSYGGRHIIGPFSRFTSIIGPNGSGKSNIMDALAFVLGVQARHLRVSNLREHIHRKSSDTDESVLYNRTASVVLVFSPDSGDEQDYIYWKRTVTFQGESKYHIDNKTVSFDEYTKQLASHNLLTKAKNFLIFQGDIETTALKSAKELTNLFELVSGSIELKDEYDALVEKKGTLLDSSKLVMSKISIISKEIRELLHQKNEADAYLRMKKKLGVEKRRLLLHRLRLLEQEGEKIQEKCGESRERRGEVEASLSSLEGEKKALQRERALLYTSSKTASAKLESKKKAFDKLEREYREMESALKRIEAEMEELQEDLDVKKKALEIDLDKVEKHQELLAKVEKRLSSAVAQQKKTIQENSKWCEREKEFDALLAENISADVSVQTKLDILQSQLLHSEQQSSLLSSEISSLESTLAHLQGEKQSLSLSSAASEKRIKELQEQITKKKKEISQLSPLLSQLSSSQENLKHQLLAQQQRKNYIAASLRDKRHNDEGIRIVAELCSLFPNDILGLLPDLIQPCSREHYKAVSASLGVYNNAIVVKTYASCLKAANHLKEKKKGYFQFLCLERLSSRGEERRGEERGGQSVISCVSFDEIIRPAVEFALADCYVADDMDKAREIAYGGGRGFNGRVVTLRGEKINRNGTMSVDEDGKKKGGKNEAGWDRGALEKEEKEYESLKDKWEKGERERREREEEKRSGEAELEKLEREEREEKGIYNSANEFGKLRESRLIATEKKLKELKKEKGEREKGEEKVKNSMENLKKKSAESHEEVFSKLAKECGVPVKELLREMKDWREKREGMEKDVDRCATEKRRMTSALSKLESHVAQTKEAIEKGEKESAKLRKQKEERDDKFGPLKTEFEKMEKEKTALWREIQSLKEKLSQMDDRGREWKAREVEARKRLSESTALLEKWKSRLTALRVDFLSLLQSAQESWMEGLLFLSDKENSTPLQWTDLQIDIVQVEIASTSETLSQKLPFPRSLSFVEDAEERRAEEMVDESDEEERTEKKNPPAGVEREMKIDYEDIEGISSTKRAIEDTENQIRQLEKEIEESNPNMKAGEKLQQLEKTLEELQNEHRQMKESMRQLDVDYRRVKRERCDRFTKCFQYCKQSIQRIYKNLTTGHHDKEDSRREEKRTEERGDDSSRRDSDRLSLRTMDHYGTRDNQITGEAFLDLEETPESNGSFDNLISYSIIPKGKSYRELKHLSGGERSFAALALLFALQSYRESPFVIFDEIDAPLDPKNVKALCEFLRWRANNDHQIIVITLKDKMFSFADSLIGTCRNNEAESSQALSLDLSIYPSQPRRFAPNPSAYTPKTVRSNYLLSSAKRRATPDEHHTPFKKLKARKNDLSPILDENSNDEN